MSDIERIADSIETTIGIMADIGKHFGNFSTGHGIGWDLLQAKALLPALIKMLPFQKGDRVELLLDHPCPGNWGQCKHFLVRGAKGVVSSVGYYEDRGFYADVVFDSESWIDGKGDVRPVTDKHTFWMEFAFLRKICP